MQNKGTKIITALAGGVAVAGILYVLAFYPFRSHTALQVSFGHTTNDPALGLVAIFNVTNQSGESIEYQTLLPQTWMTGTWSRPVWPPGFSFQALSPHSAETFMAIVPTNSGPWRVPVAWYYPEVGIIESFRKRVELNIQENYQRLMSGESPHYFSEVLRHAEAAYSETITNK